MKRLLKRWLGISALEQDIDKLLVEKYDGLKDIVDNSTATIEVDGFTKGTYSVNLPPPDKPLVKGYNATVGRTDRR